MWVSALLFFVTWIRLQFKRMRKCICNCSTANNMTFTPTPKTHLDSGGFHSTNCVYAYDVSRKVKNIHRVFMHSQSSPPSWMAFMNYVPEFPGMQQSVLWSHRIQYNRTEPNRTEPKKVVQNFDLDFLPPLLLLLMLVLVLVGFTTNLCLEQNIWMLMVLMVLFPGIARKTTRVLNTCRMNIKTKISMAIATATETAGWSLNIVSRLHMSTRTFRRLPFNLSSQCSWHRKKRNWSGGKKATSISAKYFWNVAVEQCRHVLNFIYMY